MEGCISTEKDIDKVLQKFSVHKKSSEATIQQLIDQMKLLQSEILNANDNEKLTSICLQVIPQAAKSIRTAGQKVSSQHKDLHSSVSRIGKTIDRNFSSDCSTVSVPGIFSNDEHEKQLNTAICEHYYRQGRLGIAESLVNEAKLNLDDKWVKPFVEMNEVLLSLRNRNIGPALEWARINRQSLQKSRSVLEFKLHTLKFLSILNKGVEAQQEALNYAKNFQMFAFDHTKDIQTLMGCFLYLQKGLENSPYAHVLNGNIWEEICNIFTHDACSIMGMSLESHLMSSFTAGCTALPALVTIKSVIEQRKCSGVIGLQRDELPIDIDLDPTHRYHSIFACPILRQQTTANNPPMRLTCGHIISKDALTKLNNSNKVKCPYCPMEQPTSEAKRVYF